MPLVLIVTFPRTLWEELSTRRSNRTYNAAIVDLLRRLAAQDNGTRSTADALGLIEAA